MTVRCFFCHSEIRNGGYTPINFGDMVVHVRICDSCIEATVPEK